MGQLGCSLGYDVVAIEEIVGMNTLTGQAQFGRSLGPIEGFSELVWDRRLDDTSAAVLTIPTNVDCCSSGFINTLHSWHHGLAIYRNGQQVFDGPIVTIQATRTEVVITAHDVSALWAKRLLPYDICFSTDPTVCTGGVGGVVWGPQAPEVVAQRIIEACLAVDGHGAFVDVLSDSVATYEASYRKWGGPVFDLVQKLASEFINWTVLGRRIIISRGGLLTGSGIARTALLTCDDFLNSDALTTTEDGLAALTQDVQIADAVINGGVEQTDENIGVAQVFLNTEVADAYYGLLQGVQDGSKAIDGGTNPLQVLTAAAQNIVQSAYPPSVILAADGLQLSPNAPVEMSELVPGTIVPILADCLCRPVAQMFLLSKITVTVNAEGEKVEPSFISLGADNSGPDGA